MTRSHLGGGDIKKTGHLRKDGMVNFPRVDERSICIGVTFCALHRGVMGGGLKSEHKNK